MALPDGELFQISIPMGENRGLGVEVHDRIARSNQLVVIGQRGGVLHYINRLRNELERAERVVAGEEGA